MGNYLYFYFYFYFYFWDLIDYPISSSFAYIIYSNIIFFLNIFIAYNLLLSKIICYEPFDKMMLNS